MLTTTEILELIRAGYTKEEINAMVTSAPENKDPDPAPAQDDVPASEPDPESHPEPKPEPKPQPTETEKLLAALGMKLDQMAAAIHSSNVRNLENPGETLTPEQVVAQIINPHST